MSNGWDQALRMVDREFRSLVAQARDAGWGVRTTGRHVKLVPLDPTKPLIPVASSASEVRGVRNFRAQLRRAGLEV
jgi:hypothetical protein